MKALLQPVAEIAGIDEILRFLQKDTGLIEISGTVDGQKAQLIAGLTETNARIIVVAENDLKAKQLYEDMKLYHSEVYFYPARDMIFYQAEITGNALTRNRMQVLRALSEEKSVIVVTSAGGCMESLLPFRVFQEHRISLKAEGSLEIPKLAKRLAELGYERFGEVDAPGQFAVRGGIVDVFSLTEEFPWRIEFWGDEIDSIRSFDPESQRSIEMLEEIVIDPATEELGYETDGFFDRLTDTFLDYFPAQTPIFLSEPQRLVEAAKKLSEEFMDAVSHREASGKSGTLHAGRLRTPAELVTELMKRPCIALTLIQQKMSLPECKAHYFVEVKSVNPYHNQFSSLVNDIGAWRKKGYRIILTSASHTRARRLAEELQREEIPAFYSEDPERLLDKSEVMVCYGNAAKGFEYPMQKFVLLTETDLFGKTKSKKKKSKKGGDYIRSFRELSIGDYVIHEVHGLGIYRGIETLEIDHVAKDYIRIEYDRGAGLLLPATSLELLQKFGSSERKKPKLHTLGGAEWKKTKSRVKGAVKNIAKELVALYAARQDGKGYQYGPDTVWQREFEELFPYEETGDQLQAIEETKRDMESEKIMDRLICGDVGFGKTEVAIRAAFKAVQENKQVVVLAPTTILAQQHYNTFVQRLKDFPVEIGLLCRFRTPTEQKKTISDLKKGMVDIIVGTHRVLSKDVQFKDLGLLVIDEEQRFGVTHKEKIKQLKSSVDVISLTATPIPRTLHMGLVGIRDMSVLEEAPLDRVPIQTYVSEYDEELVREAIHREMSRDGQVYYVYNRVNDIADVAGRIARLVPEARVAFAHGQMRERELERIMYDFIEGEIDVLVATTIIETGLDIPNVNTIIIHSAERMGLSQLYQLRGRVGRSNRSAYAFLMYQRDRLLKEEAEKRLHAIREFTEVGSGVKIAMRDLEIRGAGNLLGAEQSGHMEAIGYELYCKMLATAINEERGIEQIPEFETGIDLSINAFIPDSYIAEEGQKLDLYKRIAAIETEDEAENMLDECIDRFGDPPEAVRNLIEAALIKSLAHSVYVTEIKEDLRQFTFRMYEKAMLDVGRIPELLEKYDGKLKLQQGNPPEFILRKTEAAPGAKKIFHSVRYFLDALAKLRMK